MGNKQQAEDYIQKRGKFEEKGEQVIYIARYGEIKGKQGARMDFDVIEELIEQGLTPNEVMEQSFGYRRYERMIKQAYFWKRFKETPPVREIKVYWHVGESGTGKATPMSSSLRRKGSRMYICTPTSKRAALITTVGSLCSLWTNFGAKFNSASS